MLGRAAKLDLLAAIHPDLHWDTGLLYTLKMNNSNRSPNGDSKLRRKACLQDPSGLYPLADPPVTVRSCNVMARLTIPVYRR
jgi:hypothetical protein